MKAEVLINGEITVIDLAEISIDEMSEIAMTNSVEVIRYFEEN